MADETTMQEGELPWVKARAHAPRSAPTFVIAWSLEEPSRVGEIAPVTRESVLGRGGPPSDDTTTTRLVFRRARPSGIDARSSAGEPLGGSRISRVQLRVRPDGDELVVENVGRCTMQVNGVEVSEARVRPGDTVTLRNALVLLVTRRTLALSPLRAYDAPAHPFGRADALGIVGESPAAWALRDDLAFVAKSKLHVLVLGESGTGKELAARAIHAMSHRSGKPLVARNAATFPEGLVDAELFGSVKGYPNAGSPERPGLVGEADGSTLFLDEIGELPEKLQAHLLRVLDAGGEYQRLGESRAMRSDLRLVAATNRGPEALKHDFAARLAARVALPPLGSRTEDVPLLVGHIVRKLADATPSIRERFFEATTGEPRLDPDLVERLLRHTFTHHLRELERLLFLAVSTSRGAFVELTREVEGELRPQGATPAASTDEPDEERVRAALAEAGGNVTRAARALGLKNRFALYRLMKRFGIEDDEGDPGAAGG